MRRPREMMSTLAAILASSAGWRYVLPLTIVPTRRREVRPASAASAVQHPRVSPRERFGGGGRGALGRGGADPAGGGGGGGGGDRGAWGGGRGAGALRARPPGARPARSGGPAGARRRHAGLAPPARDPGRVGPLPPGAAGAAAAAPPPRPPGPPRPPSPPPPGPSPERPGLRELGPRAAFPGWHR